MIKELKAIISADETLDEADFKKAAQFLLARQFLHRSKPLQSRAYDLVVRFQKYFTELMGSVNYTLVINENRGYVGILPQDYVYRMKLEETLIMMVLRLIYDEEQYALNVEDDGSAIISVTDFCDRYTHTTKRELTRSSGAFQDYLKSFAGHGILEYEKNDQDPDNHRIRIYPVIADLLSGNMLERIGGYMQADDVQIFDDEEMNEYTISNGEQP